MFQKFSLVIIIVITTIITIVIIIVVIITTTIIIIYLDYPPWIAWWNIPHPGRLWCLLLVHQRPAIQVCSHQTSSSSPKQAPTYLLLVPIVNLGFPWWGSSCFHRTLRSPYRWWLDESHVCEWHGSYVRPEWIACLERGEYVRYKKYLRPGYIIASHNGTVWCYH